MNHFDLKSLAFYGTMITSVVAIFAVTSHYGESNLKAPAKIDGQYRLSVKDLPGCLKAETLLLSIEQSGLYINGSLLSEKDLTQASTAAKKKPLLTGLFQQSKLELTGKPSLESCQNKESTPELKIQGSIQKATLQGEILLPSGSVTFTAKREALKSAAKESH
jgi:hypothetical protein